ncbi:MAG: glycosyltransferase, partial [Bacteroidales bacterium]|nr:glycosyltransferase [Bacteroidales bacterium]
SWNWAVDFQNIGARNVEVITNGYDEDDFENIKSSPSKKFELIHIGSLNKDRNPINFWEALSELIKENKKLTKDLKITFIGQTDYSVFESLKKYSLDNYAEKADYKPHDELMNIAGTARILLLPLNDTPNVNGIIPGKLFEYIALKIPILCIGPENGDSAKIINECNAGIVADFEDKEKIKTALQGFYKEFIDGRLSYSTVDNNRLKYSRKKLTKDIADILNVISENK